MKAALRKLDRILGFAYFCPECKRFICSSGKYKCKCGTEIDLDLPAIEYTGKVIFDGD